ncbi:MAG: transcriptional repressor [Candidatus Krumholzibacteriota bacterium]|nr:transcriptional repressor [Candidatus Krumholzibacteriota bacterium]
METPANRRRTRQRQVILEELRRLTTHPTAAELHEIVRRRLPRVSLSTIYRNLELLVELGQAQKLDTASGQNRYDGDTAQHCHVRCLRCGRVDDVPELPAGVVERHGRRVRGYRLLDWRLELLGVCPACLAAERERN